MTQRSPAVATRPTTDRASWCILDGADGSRLLVDRREDDGGDPRLLAHLAAMSPTPTPGSSAASSWPRRPRVARALRPSDFGAPPDGSRDPAEHRRSSRRPRPTPHGRRYFLRASGTPAGAALAPRRRAVAAAPRRLSARDVIGALEAYEPVCPLTRAAVERFRADRSVRSRRSSVELRRDRVEPDRPQPPAARGGARGGAEHGVSLSAIAMACGRIKRDQPRQRLGRDELARPPRRAAAAGAGRPPEPVGAQRHARADRARRSGHRAARGRAP